MAFHELHGSIYFLLFNFFIMSAAMASPPQLDTKPIFRYNK